jgi:hypothetical protein
LKAIAADINSSFNASFSSMSIGVTSQITQVNELALAWGPSQRRSKAPNATST